MAESYTPSVRVARNLYVRGSMEMFGSMPKFGAEFDRMIADVERADDQNRAYWEPGVPPLTENPYTKE